MGRLNYRPSKIQGMFLKGLRSFMWLATVIVDFLNDLSQYPGLGFLRRIANLGSRLLGTIGSYEEKVRARLLRLQGSKAAAQRLKSSVRRN